MKELLEKLKAFAREHNLIQKSSYIGVAVSGGPDSVFLLRMLTAIKGEFGLKLHILHYNHSIRKESDSEEEFVKTLADELNLPFTAEKGDVLSLKREMKLSLEEAARLKRYQFFEKAKKSLGLDFIATGHTKNDFVETFIMNLLRGSSLDGLVSLKPKRDYFIRPILPFTKEEILSFLEKRKVKFVYDSSNMDETFTRNKIRLKLIEEFKTINPNILETLFREGMLLLEDSTYINKIAEVEFVKSKRGSKDKTILDLTKIDKNPTILKRVISKAVRGLLGSNYSLSSINLKRIYETAETGKTTHLRKLIRAYKQGEFLVIERYED